MQSKNGQVLFKVLNTKIIESTGIPEVNEFPTEIICQLDDLVEKYNDFSAVNLDIGEQFLGEVLRRTKEILNYIRREDGNMLYEALKVFYKFFAKDDGILQTDELINLLGIFNP